MVSFITNRNLTIYVILLNIVDQNVFMNLFLVWNTRKLVNRCFQINYWFT